MGRRHGSLDDKTANVLPALLEEGDKVVDGEHEVGNKGLLLHLDVADGNTEAQNLLELELDGGADVGDLGGHILSVGDGGRELAGCRKRHSQYALSMNVGGRIEPMAGGTYPWTDRDRADGESA